MWLLSGCLLSQVRLFFCGGALECGGVTPLSFFRCHDAKEKKERKRRHTAALQSTP
jgi:hypothetical protein